MKRERELLKNTLILGIGTFLPKIMNIITMPILTAKLTKYEYGTFDLVTTLVMLLLPISTLQIQSAAFRFLIDCRGDSDKTACIISNIFIITIPVSAFISVCLIVFAQSVTIALRFVITFYFFCDVMFASVSQVVRGLNMNKIYSESSFVLAIANGAGIIISLKVTHLGLIGVILSLGLANMLAFIYVTVKAHILNYFHISLFSKKDIRAMISYSWPMVPNNLSNWVLKLSDRLVVTSVLGLEANAVYAVANKIPNIFSLAQSVLIMAWQENASIAVDDEDADIYYSQMFDRIYSLLIGFTALLIGFTPVMFYLLIKGNYQDAYIQMPILILAMFFNCMSSFQGGIYIAHKKTKNVGTTTMIAAVINFFIDILFINMMGITAASTSTLIAYFLLYMFRLKDTLRFQKIDYKIKKQIISLVLVIIMLYLCYLNRFYINILNNIIGMVVFFILNRKICFDVLNKIISYIRGGIE